MSVDRITWFRNASESLWHTPTSHRGYTAEIERTAPAVYQLTITGAGAPGPANYPNLRAAKNAFRKYLFDKPATFA